MESLDPYVYPTSLVVVVCATIVAGYIVMHIVMKVGQQSSGTSKQQHDKNSNQLCKSALAVESSESQLMEQPAEKEVSKNDEKTPKNQVMFVSF